MTRRVPAILLLLVLFSAPLAGPLAGQACVGLLTPEDGVSYSLGSEFDHGLSLLGGRIDANTGSPFSLGVAVYAGRSGGSPGTDHAFRTSGLVELRSGGTGVCPMVSLRSSSGELPGGSEMDERSRSRVGLELAVGVGRTVVEKGGFALSWHVVPHLLLGRRTVKTAPPGGEEVTSVDGDAHLGARAGLGLGVGPILATGEVGVRSGGQRGVVTGLSLGLRF